MEYVQPGETRPAWLVGHFTAAVAEDIEHLDEMAEALRTDTLASLHVRVATVSIHPDGPTWRGCIPDSQTILVVCGRCGSIDYLPVDYDRFGNGARWRITCDDPVNMEPSALLKFGSETVCHYFVHAGEFQLLADSSPRAII